MTIKDYTEYKEAEILRLYAEVVLDDGKNVLKASLLHQGKEYTDEIEWNYNGECNREADFLEHKKEHGSW